MNEMAAAPEAPRMSFLQRLVGIYFEPARTFEDINRRGTWLALFLVVCALVLASQYVIRSRMDHETMIRKSMEYSPIKLSEEQIQAAIDRPQSAFERYSGYVIAPIGLLVAYGVTAAVFLVGFMLLGASITFKKSLAVTIWGMAPPGIVALLLGILFMYIKDPGTLEIDPASNVASNLGLLVSAREQPVLASLLSSIDIFSFWSIALLSIGFAANPDRKLTPGKAATVVIALWALWVLGKVGLKALFS
jgi:hypothetical protein